MSYPNSPFSGFPFEDDFGDRNFRSQLDDIAQRHPEFAQHLNFDRFPSSQGRRRRGSDERTQPPPENRRFERPFRSRFEDFGFPFATREFEEPPFYREEDFLPTEREEAPKNPPEEEKLSEKEEGGVKKNIQQSNTVDLGKNQEPVDDQRGQRSMSAPPENRPRFVSSINIPVQGLQTPGGGEQMGGRASQPEKPMERVIPIHVEGRDEPVLPKNPNFTSNQQQQPQPERIFGRNPSQFTQFLNKGDPQVNQEELFKQQQRAYQQKQKENYQQQKQHEPEQPQPQQQQQQQHQQESCESQEEKKKPLTQLDQIQNIQKDVSELMNRVEKFNGKPKDKEYLYLDEMLTRNLIKLDNIETEGKDNIRQARKEAIKCIEGCIGILEAKANANLNLTKENEPDQTQSDVVKDEMKDEIKNEVKDEIKNEMKDESKDEVKDEVKNEVKNEIKNEVKNEVKDEIKNEMKDEIKEEMKEKCDEKADKIEIDVPGGSLEVSGVARSGTLVVEETPMDVVEGDEKKDKKDDDGSIKPEEKKEKKKVTKKKEKVDKK